MSFPLEAFASQGGDDVGEEIMEWVQKIHARCVRFWNSFWILEEQGNDISYSALGRRTRGLVGSSFIHFAGVSTVFSASFSGIGKGWGIRIRKTLDMPRP